MTNLENQVKSNQFSFPLFLEKEQIELWKRDGFLHLKNFFTLQEKKDFQDWASELSSWPESPGQWMKYFEMVKQEDGSLNRQLCRVENFLTYHRGFSNLLEREDLLGTVSDLMGEKSVLFKEKINYKYPGGQGFLPHQDAPAFVTFNQSYHITMMISIDASDKENGYLEVVRGRHEEGLFPGESDGTLHQGIVERFHWESVPTQPGDILLFGSFLPHRSGPNTSDRSRRALYITYNRLSEGCRRQDYYDHKRKNFPPECERVAGVDYSEGASIYNLGNPIK